jgi:hypothetical protein
MSFVIQIFTCCIVFPRLVSLSIFPRLISFQQFRLDYFCFSPAYIVYVLCKPMNLGLTN